MRKFAWLLVVVLGWFGALEAAEKTVAIGSTIADLSFKDTRYLTRNLSELGQSQATVIVITKSTCPVSKRYLPVLGEMERRYRDRGVRFLALEVDQDQPLIEIAADALEAKIDFPVGLDVEQRVRLALGVTRTPEVAVLDSSRKLRYRGRIDDQFRLSGDQPQVTKQSLNDAIHAILSNQKIQVSETSVDGCLITSLVVDDHKSTVDYATAVAPILAKHCQECHRPGTEAPFSLTTYRDVASHGEMVAEVVTDRRMPPWFASERHGKFVNRRGLTDSERETVLAWIKGGMPRGDLSKLKSEKQGPIGKWRIGEPDLVTTTPFEQQIPATGFVDYRYVVFPHVFMEDTWVQAVEILPDNPRVVHHANLAYMKLGARPSADNFITGRVPGGDSMDLDEATCVLIPKGSVIGLQIHFTTTGKPERTKISIGLKFPRVPVAKRLYHQQVHTSRFKIPPLSPAHEVKATRMLEFDATGVGLFSHMHVRGKDMTFLAYRPDGTTDTLLMIPNYNFDWQQSFRWATGATKFPKGTKFEAIAHFDNSVFNPFNPDPSASIGHGDQTIHEMMYGFYFYTKDDENLGIKVDTKTGYAQKPR
jgi:thiol-disulfide isomerase/thioredoxin